MLEIKGIDMDEIKGVVSKALYEDIRDGDITTESLIPDSMRGEACLKAKESGIICGLWVAELVFRQLSQDIVFKPLVSDGESISEGSVLAEITGSMRAILTGERTALNFLQRMSGISTATSGFVHKLEGLNAKILDTRKTAPCMRLLDKYAVKAGGGENHRIGLYDMVLIKDNHIDAAGSIKNAVSEIKGSLQKAVKIEIEARNLDEVRQALIENPDVIMFDNMSISDMKEGVIAVDGRAKTEASGNISLDMVREVALTGVDYISVGSLTHSVRALDLSQYSWISHD